MPSIEQRLVGQNFWHGRNGQKVIAIVNHIMESSIESADAWFHNPASQVSAHFGVARDGRIWQWVGTANSAWGNGIWQSPDQSVQWIAAAFQRGINPNNLTVSIEHEGNSGEAFTEEQYQATLWLHKQLISQFGIVADRQHIVGHYQIMSRDRSNCPGAAFPWARLIADLQPAQQPPTLDLLQPPASKFVVGPGLLSLMQQLGDEPASNERYLKYEDTGEEISEADSTTRVYRWIKSTGQRQVFLKTGQTY